MWLRTPCFLETTDYKVDDSEVFNHDDPYLDTDRAVLVDIEIINMDLSLHSHCSKEDSKQVHCSKKYCSHKKYSYDHYCLKYLSRLHSIFCNEDNVAK